MNTTKEIMQRVSLEELTEEPNLLCFTYMLTYMQSLNLFKKFTINGNRHIYDTEASLLLFRICFCDYADATTYL